MRAAGVPVAAMKTKGEKMTATETMTINESITARFTDAECSVQLHAKRPSGVVAKSTHYTSEALLGRLESYGVPGARQIADRVWLAVLRLCKTRPQQAAE